MTAAQAVLPASVAAEQPQAASVRTPRLRLPVAVLVSRFPVVTETFILRELIELERQGQPVVLVPLLREKVEVVHREAEPWVKRALYTPFLSAEIAAANWRCLRARPRDYARLLWGVVKGNAGSPHMLMRALAFFPKTVHLAERLQAEGVGHVHAHFATHPGMSAWLIGALTGIPYSLTVHAHDIFVRRDMLEVKLAGARFVRCISEFNRRFLAARYPDAGHKLVVVHTGVDLDVDTPERAIRVVPAGSAPRVLCVAAMKPYKGHLVLLEACRLLVKRGADFVCELVGEGPLRGRIEREVKRAGLLERVRLLGARPQHDVAALISQARVVVLPSVVAADGQMEGLPVTLMEAMAAGCPVVAPALSGIPELVEDGINGLLVPTGDVEALAAAIQRLLLEPKVARWMGEQGRRKVEREFALRDCVSQLLDWFDRERRPAPAVWRERLAAERWSWPALGLRRLHERPDSSVAELLLPASYGTAAAAEPRELVLKIHHGLDGAPSPRHARREFQVLSRLEQVFGDGAEGETLGVPRPLGLDEAQGSVLMRACPGRTLEALIRGLRWRARAAQAPAEAAVRRCGAWLRRLQERTREAGHAGLLHSLMEAARRDLAACSLPRDLASGLERRIQALGEQVDVTALEAVGHHGDLWPGNIFIAEGSVGVVDFEGYRRGLAEEDPAYFLVELELYYAYPLLGARRRRMSSAFLDGYGSGRLDEPLGRLCRLAKVLQVLARTRRDGPSRWRHRWRRRVLLSMLGPERP